MTSPSLLTTALGWTRTGGARAAATAGGLLGLWALLAVVLPRGMPPGIVLLGATLGALYGLVAVGIVLVYRANRVVNFAQAELGAVAAVVSLWLVTARGWSYLPAILTGVVLAVGTGALVETTILRRLRRAPRLIVTVATIGIAQLLNGISIVAALTLAGGAAAGAFETPFAFRFELYPVVFSGDHLMVLIVVPAVLVGIGALLRYTDYGVAIRAAADSNDRAMLLGVPVARLATIVWALAAALSVVAIMLRLPLTGFISFTAVSGGGTALLLRALAAAVIARMDRVGVAAGAAVVLGVVEAAAAWSYGNTAYADGILVLVILGALLVQRGTFSRSEGLSATATFQAIREVRPVPAELRTLPEVRLGQHGLKLVLLAGALIVPVLAGPSRVQLGTLILIYALVAISLVVLTGWAGHISLGHWALVGIGGTATGALFVRHGLDLVIAAGLGIAVAAAVAVLLGIPALRVRGPFFAVTTLAFAVTASTLLLNTRYVPWLAGDRLERPSLFGRIPLQQEWQLYYLALVVLVVAIASVQALRRSRTGRVLVAIRDNPGNAATFGVSRTRLQLAAFAISGALAGCAGVLYLLHQGGIRQDAFDPVMGLRIFSMVVIGGLGSLSGGVLGAVFITGAEYFLSAGWALIASGAGIVVLLLVAPGGLGQVVYAGRDRLLRLIADRRGIAVPSLVADAGDTGPDPGAVTSGSAHDPDAFLSVRGLAASYDRVQVLFDVDLDVQQGEILALLGTNGAGKSTVLRAITGLLPPDKGRILLDGEDLTAAPPRATVASGIVMMPGGRAVFPNLTVEDNLRIAAWTRRSEPDEVQAARDRALEHFPILRTRWHTAAGNLSGGEQQMLGLAQTLLARPRLVLIDELTLGLAPSVVGQLLEIVREINRAGTTVVVVEQSVTTALELARRAIFMEKGAVRFTGPTKDLLDRPDLLRSVFLGGHGDASKRGAPARTTAATGGEPVLVASGLVKRYGGIRACDQVSLRVEEGEIVGIIGPNGAGKTTLFDLLSGLETTDAGTIEVLGQDVTTWGPHRRARLGLGRSFQDARLWPSLTVAEAIAVALERHVATPGPLPALAGLPATAESEAEVTRRVEELIELLGLGAFRDKFVSELSTGSRRMVEIAGLLAQRAQVLLLDEPSAGIAQRETEALVPVLADLRTTMGCSIVVIEHDMRMLTNLVDRMVALDQGATLTEGPPDEVLRHPEVVRSYLGGAPTAAAVP